MQAGRPERQIVNDANSRDRQGPVEMREHLPAARRLPAQAFAKAPGIDLEKEEPGLPAAMTPGRFGHLVPCGEMNEPVGGVLRGSGIGA